MTTIKSSLPHDPEAERCVVGSILLNPETLPDVAAVLSPRDFFEPNGPLRGIYTHLLRLSRDGQPIEAQFLHRRMSAGREWDDSTAALVAELVNEVATGLNAVFYAELVRECSQKRRLAGVLSEGLEAANNGKPVSDVLSSIEGDLFGLRADGEIAGPTMPGSIEDLIADNPTLPEPVIDGLLRRGETANIIAPPKAGKSWLAYALALSIATGREWLDSFTCRPGRVLLIDNELAPSVIASRVQSVAGAMAIQGAEYFENLDVIPLRGRLVDLHGIAAILERIEPGTYDLIILDAWYRALPDGISENDNAQVAGLYNVIDAATARLGCAWINIHHSSKGSQGDKSVVDVGAGAGSQARAADTHIILRSHEDEGAVVLAAALRSFAPVEPLALRWTFPVWTRAEDLDPAKLKDRRTKQELKQAVRDQEGIEQIKQAMTEAQADQDGPPEPVTRGELQHRSGLSRTRCGNILDLMEAKGLIDGKPITVRGNMTRTYENIT